jgi:hypothetical protein
MIYGVILACVSTICLAAIQCFKIKYTDTKEYEEIKDNVAKLEHRLKTIDADSIKNLQVEVSALRNHYGFSAKR